jgi:hypothetical protein
LQWIHFFLCSHHQSFLIVSLAGLAILVNGLANGGWRVVSRTGESLLLGLCTMLNEKYVINDAFYDDRHVMYS